MSLLDDLQAAEAKARGELPCKLCDYIRAVDDDDTREALRAAGAGSIGYRALLKILVAHEAGVSERQVRRHRSEGHTP